VAGDRKKFELALTHAKRFADEGNWNEATRAYRFALGEFPNDQAAIFGFGQATLFAGNIDLAQKAFQQLLKIDAGNYQALHYMAEIQEHSGRLDEAAESHLRVGNILAAQGDLEAAVESWRSATQLMPNQLDAQRKLAEGLANLGEVRPAARQFLTLAAIYQERQDNDQARYQIQSAQELIGPEPGINAALAALAEGRPIDPDQIGDVPLPEHMATDDLFDYPDSDRPYPAQATYGEEDLFALWDEPAGPPARGGLIELAQQEALSELANVVFEDEGRAGFQTAIIPRDELNMLIIQAIDLQSQDDLVNAVNNYRRVVKAGVSNTSVFFNLGLLTKELGQYDEAVKMLKAATQSEEYRVPAHFALGQTFYATGDLETALRHFIEAVKTVDLKTVDSYKAGELSQHYETLADTYLVGGGEKKINDFIAALQTFFSKPDWESKVYEARQRMNSVAENGSLMSLVEFLETVETEVIITTLAVTGEYMKRNLLMTASEECLRAIQKVPSSLLLHVRLADVLLKMDHPDAAIEKYLTVAKVYLIRNQLDKAINVYQKILRLAPMDVTVRSKLIDLYISNRNFEEAVDQYLTLANSYYQLAQVDRAIEKYNEALRLTANLENPASWRVEIYGQIGDIYNQRFDWVRATAAFEELLKLRSNDERVLRQLVDLYFKQHKMDPAIKNLDILLVAYRQAGSSDRMLDLLRELTATFPENMLLRQRLAQAYAENGQKSAAIAEYDALGEMQLEKGLRDQAMQTIQAILNLQPEDVEGYRRLLAQISGGAI
jgi:tetratricopeptide (TPR) repeat protein